MAVLRVVAALCLTAFVCFADAENNVYGKPLAHCGSTKECAYHKADAGAHEICATKLPKGFSSKTGQGKWSDQFTGKPWCICIWAYSNYILHHSNMPVNCNAIPAKVLEEKYSLKKFAQCGKMSSKNGCGPEDIRRSIKRICSQCSSSAPGAAAKSALLAKCKKIKAAAQGSSKKKAPAKLKAPAKKAVFRKKKKAAALAQIKDTSDTVTEMEWEEN